MSTQNSAVLLHVGFIKTATTFLQNQVFANPDDGLELAAGPLTRAHLVQNIILGDDFSFAPDAVRHRLEKLSAPVRARGNLPVWSEETLLGDPTSRRYDGFSNARKLNQVYPDAKILITIRHQPAIALSMYREYVLGGGALPLGAFIGTGEEALSFSSILRAKFLEFDTAIAHYMELFGADNVLVLPQEMLAHDPESYLGKIVAFTGCNIALHRPRARVHVGEGGTALNVRRLSNRFVLIDPTRPGRHGLAALTSRVARGIDRLAPARLDRKFENDLKSRIENRYSGTFTQSNRRTAALARLPLSDLGYKM